MYIFHHTYILGNESFNRGSHVGIPYFEGFASKENGAAVIQLLVIA